MHRAGPADKVAAKMASYESIGSCSLDVDATASESSEAVDGSLSQRTLHSVSLDVTGGGGGVTSQPGQNSPPQYVRRTVQLFNSIAQPPAQTNGHAGGTLNGVIEENGETKDSSSQVTSVKQPSYVGLSCAISGYSSITDYSVRGLKMRDGSPARPSPSNVKKLEAPTLVKEINKDRKMKSTEKNKGSNKTKHSESVSENGEKIHVSTKEIKVTVNGSHDYHDGQVDTVFSRTNGTAKTTKTINVGLSPHDGQPVPRPISPGAVRVIQFQTEGRSYVETTRHVYSSSTTSSSKELLMKDESDDELYHELGPKFGETDFRKHFNIHHASPGSCSSNAASSYFFTTASHEVESTPSLGEPKSFIEQRIERLYGPGALAQGFFKKLQLREKQKENLSDYEPSSTSRVSMSLASLPVFKHLRPEFREQLPMRSLLHKMGNLDISEDSKVPTGREYVIPIKIEKDTRDINGNEEISSEVIAPSECVPVLEPCIAVPVKPLQRKQDERPLSPSSVPMDGHYFLQVLESESQRIALMASKVEEELEGPTGASLAEEASGKLRAATGKARLLLRQKMQQFAGLCQRNITRSEDDPFPTTDEDLAGFWDMVKLQVEHIDQLFQEIEELRNNGWKETKESPSKATGPAIASSSSVKKRNPSRRPVASGGKQSEAAKARDEARKKLMEEKRKVMKKQREAAEVNNEEVEIFVPADVNK